MAPVGHETRPWRARLVAGRGGVWMTASRRVRLYDFSPVRDTACCDVAGCVHVGVLSEAARRATERGLVRPVLFTGVPAL